MQVSPIEGQRIVAILNETIEKLEVLDAMAPEISASHNKEESAKLVNDEISRIIDEQHHLQARYEELINQRSQLRNVSNKAKHKEIQAEIEEIATSLRYATKVLCRNLKENPDAADNNRKIQSERSLIKDLLINVAKEISNEGTFRILIETVESEKKKETLIRDTRANVKKIVEDTKRTYEEIAELSEERKRDEQSQNQIIEKLREDLQELRAKSVLEGKYQKKESKAFGDANRRVFQQQERQKQNEINELERKLELEAKVHEETSAFLERKHADLQRWTEHWDGKYEQHIEEKERELEALKSKKSNDLAKLNELKIKFSTVHDLVMKEKRLSEARSYHHRMQTRRTEAAIILQTSWRKYKKRKAAKEKLKRLKKEAGAKRSTNPVLSQDKAKKKPKPKKIPAKMPESAPSKSVVNQIPTFALQTS